jgi:hypothetical protein
LAGKRKFCLITGTGLAISIQTHRKEPAIILTSLAMRSLSLSLSLEREIEREATLLLWTSSILRLHELTK